MSAVDETEEQMLIRHKKENKDLIATVTGLKKQATKSKRKEVNKKCLELELNLKEKHERELKVCSMMPWVWMDDVLIPKIGVEDQEW
jgi:OTU domain-containing protein 6